MAYLMHFNRNHSRKDGRFVKGDGDGDGKPNDHINPNIGNKRIYTEYGRKVGGAKANAGSYIVRTSKSVDSEDDSKKKIESHTSAIKSIVNDYKKTEDETDEKKKMETFTKEESTSNTVTPHINADGSAVYMTPDGKVHIVNRGGVKNLKDYAMKRYDIEHPKIEKDVGKDPEPTVTNSTPVSKVKSSSKGQSYTEKKKEEHVPTESETAKFKAKVNEYAERYGGKSASSTSSTTKKKKSKVSNTYFNINI